jgi:hypothetical protein
MDINFIFDWRITLMVAKPDLDVLALDYDVPTAQTALTFAQRIRNGAARQAIGPFV